MKQENYFYLNLLYIKNLRCSRGTSKIIKISRERFPVCNDDFNYYQQFQIIFVANVLRALEQTKSVIGSLVFGLYFLKIC